MSEKALEISKALMTKAGRIALLLMRTGAELGVKLATKGAQLAAKSAELTTAYLRTKPAQKLRPVMRVVMCVSATVAILSGILYFLGRKKE